MGMFEMACANKLRFTTRKGNFTAEDLFDLPLQSDRDTSLESIWVALNKEIKDTDTSESPLKTTNGASKELTTKFAIVSRVIEIRLAARDARIGAKAKKERNEQIMRLIADKENDALAGKSIEELRALME